MKLRYDPYQIFQNSKTPAGLYARQKWLGEAETDRWKRDFRETVSALLANQLPDGSWFHSPLTTIKQLFGLHLTVRSSNSQIKAALAWLLNKIDLKENMIRISSEAGKKADDLTGLPFIRSRPDMLMTGATLFLATIFGRDADPNIVAKYQWLSAKGEENNGQWFDEASSHNIFRAMVVHPDFAKSKATELAVKRLAALQTDCGDWQNEMAFYQTINALAHLDFTRAEQQLEKAFERLFDTQSRNGSWGQNEPEWNTFLAIHALRNKGLL